MLLGSRVEAVPSPEAMENGQKVCSRSSRGSKEGIKRLVFSSFTRSPALTFTLPTFVEPVRAHLTYLSGCLSSWYRCAPCMRQTVHNGPL